METLAAIISAFIAAAGFVRKILSGRKPATATDQKLADDENRLEAIHEDKKIDAAIDAHPDDDSLLFAPKDRKARR